MTGNKRPGNELETIQDAIVVGICVFAFVLVFSGLFGCANIPGPFPINVPQADVVYKYDMSGTVNGVNFNGVGVIPYSKDYTFNVSSREDIDLLTITSCHRDFAVESAVKTNWLNPKRTYAYWYVPAFGIEDAGPCLVRFGSYNKGVGGQNAWAIIDFETPEAKLPADNYCDVEAFAENGVTICQSKIGLLQKLVFKTPVRLALDQISDQCKIQVPADNMTWEYKIPKGECVYAFHEIAAPHRIHRHTTVGYNQIFIRGN
jgi:hypothetical protein